MTYQPAWKDINDGNPNGPPGPTTPLLSSGNSSSAVSFRESQDRGTRFSFSVFNLMNAIMGSGILGLAYAVSECGIALFIFLLIVVVLATIYSVNLLLEMCNMTGVMAYENIGFVALKNPGKVLTAAIIMTQNIGSMSSYLFIIKTELPEVIETLSGQDGRTDLWYHDGTALVLMVMAFVILPLSCLPKIGFLSYTSSFSVISMTFFMIVVVVEKFRLPCPIPQPELNTTTAEPYYTEATQGWDSIKASSHDNSTCQPKYVTISVDTAYAIPTMTFSFVCHTAVIPIYKELSSPTKARMLGVSVTALLACFVLYFTTGIFGYLTFYENVNSELLLSYSQYPTPIPIISVVRLIVLIAIIFHLPVIHFPCRISLMMLMQMILPRMAPSRAYVIGIHVTSTLILLSTITFIALVVPDIRVIFGIFGATSSVCLMLFLPSLFYILIAPGALYSPRKIIPCVMFVSSFLILGVSLTTIIYGFVHPKK